MALIQCPDCGVDVSSSALACPACAYPVAQRVEKNSRAGGTGRWDPRVAFEVTKSIAARLVLGGVLLASGVAWDAPPVVLSSLVVVGSCVPLWLKARKAARLGAGATSGALEAKLRAYVADAEERQLRLADLEEENSRRIAEMEERLDFAERLLARQGEGVNDGDRDALRLPPSRVT
jgi:hypothetical protein